MSPARRRSAGSFRSRLSMAAVVLLAAVTASLLPALTPVAGAATLPQLATALRAADLAAQAAREQAVAETDLLLTATADWEAGTAAAAELRAAAARSALESGTARSRTAARQQAVDAFAAAVYRDPGGADLRVALTVGREDAPAALGTLTQLAHAGSSGAASLQALRTAEEEIAAAEAEQARMLAQAEADEADLARQLEQLRAAASRTSAELTAAESALQVAQDALIDAQAAQTRVIASADAKIRAKQEAAARAAAVTALAGQIPIGPPCSDATTAGYPNGQVPPQALCPLAGTRSHSLRADAAAAWDAMSAASLASRGVALCVTDSYRSYAAQVDVYLRKPTLAAIPGTSNHGKGIAVDVGCGGDVFGSEVFTWLTANAAAYGWSHPSWARQGGSRPEPWHWEFTPPQG